MESVAYSVDLVSRDAAGEPIELDEADWRVRALELREAIDEPFWLELTMIADNVALDVNTLVGGSTKVSIRHDEWERELRGVVTKGRYLGTFDDTVHLQLVVQPTLALAELVERSRIFQGLTVPDIVAEVAGEHLGDSGSIRNDLVESYPQRDYCVQFRETDLAFMRRILAEAGVAFVLEQDREAGGQVLVLVDANSKYKAVAVGDGNAEGVVPVLTDDLPSADAAISQLEWRRQTQTKKHAARAFDWLAAAPAPLDHEVDPEAPGPSEYGERYVHSAVRTLEGGEGHVDATEQLAMLLRERACSRATRAFGRSNALGFQAGATFTLEEHPSERIAQTYLLTRVVHRADRPDADVRDQAGGLHGPSYENDFECAPLETPYRPEPRRKPRAYGHQTATVVGPPGEEIHTDKLGRIRVWMHWDRQGPEEAADHGCWLRVTQPLAGPGFGTMFLPRVGMEVLVSFVDGDPDRPVCVGCLYDGGNMTPYPLPEDRTKTTIKTRSSPGGDGFNELRFEDAAGSEQVFLHAQRNLDETVKNAHSMNVGASQSISVGAKQTIGVGGDQKTEVRGNQTIVINGSPKDGVPFGQRTKVIGQIMTEATKSATHMAPEMITLQCGPTSIVLTPQAITLTSGGGVVVNLTSALVAAAAGAATQLSMGADGVASLSNATGAGLTLTSKQTALTSAATASVTLDGAIKAATPAGAKLEMASDIQMQGAAVKIDGGGSKVELTPGQADMSSTLVKVGSATASLELNPGAAKLQATKVDITGGAMVNILGPLVKIN